MAHTHDGHDLSSLTHAHSHSHSQPHAHAHSHSPTSSPSHSPAASTTVTTPDQSSGDDDDIWDTSSDHHDELQRHRHSSHHDNDNDLVIPNPVSHDGPRGQARILSDVPTLRRQHMTDGYREGLSIGKAQVMQDGFDVGYPLGVAVGMRIGVVLGVLEGVLAGLRKGRSSAGGSIGRSGSKGITEGREARPSGVESGNKGVVAAGSAEALQGGKEENIDFVVKLHEKAKQELSIVELMKSLDDEKVAHLHETADVPPEIEAVIAKWEGIVLPSLQEKMNVRDDEDLASKQ